MWMLCLTLACAFGRTYAVDGIVIAVDPVASTMLVAHKPIDKLMPGMSMPFHVAQREQLDALHPGMHITFDLVIGKAGSFARNVQPSGGPDQPIAAPRGQLRIGDALPDVTLIDQDGQPMRLSDLHGKVLAVDFIYTRCPLPDVCPRLSANFAALQKRLAGRDVVLVSITVDPDYDTPTVLHDYAKRWGAWPERWKFLTGDVAVIASALGEVYWTDEGSIGHNTSTALISRDGRLAALTGGVRWRVDQLEKLILHEIQK